MRVFTPVEIAKHAANKYLGVLVAAKYARVLNEFPRDRSSSREKKLTTRSLEELSSGDIEYRVVPARASRGVRRLAGSSDGPFDRPPHPPRRHGRDRELQIGVARAPAHAGGRRSGRRADARRDRVRRRDHVRGAHRPPGAHGCSIAGARARSHQARARGATRSSSRRRPRTSCARRAPARPTICSPPACSPRRAACCSCPR